MTTRSNIAGRVVGPEEGDKLPWAHGSLNRYVVDAKDTNGTIAIVEHRVAAHTLPGPVHIHSREDEYSYVLEGEVVALLGDREVIGKAGDVIVKPRGEWHAFWNPTDAPLRILEIIVPGGLDEFFRQMSGDSLDPSTLPAAAAALGCDLDLERTMKLVQERGLRF